MDSLISSSFMYLSAMDHKVSPEETSNSIYSGIVELSAVFMPKAKFTVMVNNIIVIATNSVNLNLLVIL